MSTYIPDLYDAPRLRELVKQHGSIRSIAKAYTCSADAVRRALNWCGVELPTSRYAVIATQKRFQRDEAIRKRQLHYHAAHTEGRRRQAIIYKLARLLQQRKSPREITNELHISLQFYGRLCKSPYVRALHWAWGEIQLREAERYTLAREMIEAGFDSRCISRTLEVSTDAITREYRVDI